MTTETCLPDNNPKTAFGAKKTPLHLLPPPAMRELSHAMAVGAAKYGSYNWREKTVSSSVYHAAALRHMFAWWDGEDTDPETGVSHLAHAMACFVILLDAAAHGKVNDDRPTKSV